MPHPASQHHSNPLSIPLASAGQSKWALLIGIDRYPNLPQRNQLQGCVRDTVRLEHLLYSRYGFPHENVTILRDENATRREILRAFDRLTRRVRRDDIVVVQYSGHGSRRRDHSRGSGWAETIVPHDCGCLSTGHPRTDVSDVEIRTRLLDPLAVKTGYITLLFDSCRSGSIVRDDFGEAIRGIDPDDEDPDSLKGVITASVDDIHSGWFPINERYVLLAACRAHQHALEQRFGGEHHGAFTFRLLEQIESGSANNPQALFEQAVARVTADFPGQQPLMEGARDTPLFGTERLETLRFLLVKSVSGSGIRMQGGIAEGVTIGSTWSVRPPTSTTPTATIRIDAVYSFESDARIIEGTVQAEDRCFELSHDYGEASLKVFVSPHGLLQQHPELDELLQQRNLSGVLNVLPEDESATADVKIVFKQTSITDDSPVPQQGQTTSGSWAAFGLDGHLLFPLSDDPGVFCENLRKLARYRFGLGIRNVDHANSLHGKLSIQLLRRNTDEGQGWVPVQPGAGGFPLFHTGERISCNITNSSARTVYIYVLEFAEDGSVTQMYPMAGDELLKPGGSATNVITGTLRLSNDHLSWLTNDERLANGFTEVYKVFASTQPLNLSQFMQSRYALRDNRATILDQAIGEIEWETTQACFILMKN